MKIKPLAGIVQLKIEKPTAGVLDTSSKPSAIPVGEVIAIGKGVEELSVGDKVFVESWGVSIQDYKDKPYYFVNVENKSILAIIE